MCNFFGDDPPTPPDLPPPPKREEMMDVIDRIAGAQSIEVVGADGKKRREIMRLPRTGNEKIIFEAGEDLLKQVIANVKQDYKNNPRQVIPFQPIIDVFANIGEERQNDLAQLGGFADIAREVADYKRMNDALLTEQISARDRAMEESFAHRGISDSTAATEYRAAAARNADLARMQTGVNADMYGNELAKQKIANYASAFNLREQGRAGQLAKEEAAFNLKSQERDAALADKRAQNLNALQIGGGIVQNDLNKAQGSPAPALANQIFALQNNDALQRYNLDLNRRNMNYQNELAAYNAQGPSFGEQLLGLGGQVAGAMFMGRPDSIAGRAGNAVFGGMFGGK